MIFCNKKQLRRFIAFFKKTRNYLYHFMVTISNNYPKIQRFLTYKNLQYTNQASKCSNPHPEQSVSSPSMVLSGSPN